MSPFTPDRNRSKYSLYTKRSQWSNLSSMGKKMLEEGSLRSSYHHEGFGSRVSSGSNSALGDNSFRVTSKFNPIPSTGRRFDESSYGFSQRESEPRPVRARLVDSMANGVHNYTPFVPKQRISFHHQFR